VDFILRARVNPSYLQLSSSSKHRCSRCIASSIPRIISSRNARLRHHRQRPGPPTRKYPHDPKAHIKQPQRICHQPLHPTHPAYRTKHCATAERAPHYCQTGQHIADQRVHWDCDADQGGEHEREEAIAEDGGGTGKGEGGGEVRGAEGSAWRGDGVGGGGDRGVEGRGHEGENCVEGGAAQESEAVDVAEVDFAGLF